MVNGHITKGMARVALGLERWGKRRKKKEYDVSAKQRHSDTAHAH